MRAFFTARNLPAQAVAAKANPPPSTAFPGDRDPAEIKGGVRVILKASLLHLVQFRVNGVLDLGDRGAGFDLAAVAEHDI